MQSRDWKTESKEQISKAYIYFETWVNFSGGILRENICIIYWKIQYIFCNFILQESARDAMPYINGQKMELQEQIPKA
jgi:hypothetical protein